MTLLLVAFAPCHHWVALWYPPLLSYAVRLLIQFSCLKLFNQTAHSYTIFFFLFHRGGAGNEQFAFGKGSRGFAFVFGATRRAPFLQFTLQIGFAKFSWTPRCAVYQIIQMGCILLLLLHTALHWFAGIINIGLLLLLLHHTC